MASGIETAMIRVLLQSPRKEKDHDGRQTPRDHRFARDAVDGPGDEDRLVCQRYNVQGRRQGRFQGRDQTLDALHDGQGRGGASLLNDQQDRPLAVDTDNVGLWRTAVVNMGHIADANGCAILKVLIWDRI